MDDICLIVTSGYTCIEVNLENVITMTITMIDSCSDGEHSCHLHIHFHGCGMERGWLGDGYIQRTGFLPLAEANNIVMMFPQVSLGEE